MFTVYSPGQSNRPQARGLSEGQPLVANASVSDNDPLPTQSTQLTRSGQPTTRGLYQGGTATISETAAMSRPAPMGMHEMIRVLKERRLAVHGLHVFLLGMPAILSLASAYATDKITRKVFFDTLDTFVHHARRAYPTHPKAIRHHHLVALGIPDAVIQKFPIAGAGLDIWTVAGLFNGVIDTTDIELLYHSEQKGLFQQRHFPGTHTVSVPPLCNYKNAWTGESLVLAFSSWSLSHFDEVIPPACALLEHKPDYYDPITHYMLRLRAANDKGETLSLFTFKDRDRMDAVFNDIFHIVDRDYEPGDNPREEWETFHFVEPPVRDRKPAAPASSPRDCTSFCKVA